MANVKLRDSRVPERVPQVAGLMPLGGVLPKTRNAITEPRSR